MKLYLNNLEVFWPVKNDIFGESCYSLSKIITEQIFLDILKVRCKRGLRVASKQILRPVLPCEKIK
jgi:hypothetical protein